MLVQSRSYRLLDSGGASRLESFGDLVVRRPCPSALWQPGLPASRWDSADLVLRPEADGAWEGARANQLGEQWYMASEVGFSLGLWPGQRGQVGAFPEQGTNWRWLRSACEASPRRVRVRSLLPLSRPELAVPRGAIVRPNRLAGAQPVWLHGRRFTGVPRLAERGRHPPRRRPRRRLSRALQRRAVGPFWRACAVDRR